MTRNEIGRLQYCEKVLQHSTHAMSGWTEDKRLTGKLHRKLRGKLMAKTLHTTDQAKCSLLDVWLKVNYQREVVDVCMDVSFNLSPHPQQPWLHFISMQATG